MSKGPGKWQRMILAELAGREAFHLRALLGRECTKAEYNALLRAAMKLEAAGEIYITRFSWGARPGTGKTIIHRIGTTVADRGELEREDRDRICLPRPVWERDTHLTIDAEYSRAGAVR